MVFLRTLRIYCFPLLVVLVALLIQWLGLAENARYERTTIQAGQWWRLISGHFAHLDWVHLVVNAIALLLIWDLFYKERPVWKSVVEFFLLSLAIAAALFIFSPEVSWYVGLSGVLHGTFTIACIEKALRGNKLAIAAVCGVSLKLAWEQTVGTTTEFLFDAESVVTQAHLYGALAAVAILLVEQVPQLVNGNRR